MVATLAALLLPTTVLGAASGMDGSMDAMAAQGREAQALHLNPGEAPREEVWGAGMIEQTLEVDVFVAGGGSAGTSATLAAARNGATVVLANGRPVLGGNSGSEVRLRMVGACGGRAAGNNNALTLECREGGIVEEYQLDNAVNNPDLVPELFSLEVFSLSFVSHDSHSSLTCLSFSLSHFSHVSLSRARVSQLLTLMKAEPKVTLFQNTWLV